MPRAPITLDPGHSVAKARHFALVCRPLVNEPHISRDQNRGSQQTEDRELEVNADKSPGI